VRRAAISALESVVVIILALDTSSRHCSMALLRDGDVIASTAGVTEEPYASRVFTDTGGILRQAGMELAQIELFAVATGPGSFTGLRVGLTAVKGWSEVLGRPIAPVSTLEAIAVQASGAGALVAPVIDARGGQVFGGLFRRDHADGGLHLIGEELVLPPAEYFSWVEQQAGGEAPIFVTTTEDIVAPALASSPFAGAQLESVSPELAPFIGRLGLIRSLRGQLVDALSLEANYVRRSDAEVKWRGG
jgi:tRNA threonylcarbamoyladenosine biosynthesis protein TsaB